ncbi:MAG TPA: uroporphyrinogen decarboxylase family protein [Planctomycetota bacterium]|jgi:hypothetical protein
MSYQIGIDTIRLRPTPRLAHTEYCSNDALIRAVVRDRRTFEDAWDIDLIWHTNDGPVSWAERGRVTDMGHAEFLEGGVDRREAKASPFTDVEEVLAFDAVKEYGLPDMPSLVAYYEQLYKDEQARHPEQVFTGGYYKTIVSGAIESFGWEMLLLAAAEPERFERVLDSFFRLSLHHFKAWAQTSAPVFICHDDMVWTRGPFMHPDFYRRAIFPRYQQLWSVLKSAGKKILYCSDGDWTVFIDDIAAAGADGFIFEPMTSLEKVVEHCGKTHVIVSSKVDCRTLTFGTLAEIQAELDETLKLARRCKAFMCAVGNHIPSNVPVENALFYYNYLKERWGREGQ